MQASSCLLFRATNWAKLSATASLGVIHRGHENESLALMQGYLPKDTSGNSSGKTNRKALFNIVAFEPSLLVLDSNKSRSSQGLVLRELV